MHIPTEHPATVQLLISRSCPHCNSLIQICLDLIKSGKISRLDIINIETPPQELDVKNIRSVPYMKIGTLGFEGLHTKEEIQYWASHADKVETIEKYVDENLRSGKIGQIRDLLASNKSYYRILIGLLGNRETVLHTRIGISALLEEIAGSETLRELFADLAQLTVHEDANIRADACHLLSLTDVQEARKYLEARLEDPAASVREIASESLEQLNDI